MTIDPNQLEVKHNSEEKRFEVVLGDKIAMVEYMFGGKNMVFTHTEVPPEFEGMGVANKMAHVALEYAKAEGYKVQALCPFISLYVRKHPEYQSITWGYESK
ncbi:MAG: N-acetyltransferase [Anaerolineae bacterium]|nr:N-acetyltransferase [Anaerolineae bacterium]